MATDEQHKHKYETVEYIDEYEDHELHAKFGTTLKRPLKRFKIIVCKCGDKRAVDLVDKENS